jgi:hypothetical protein
VFLDKKRGFLMRGGNLPVVEAVCKGFLFFIFFCAVVRMRERCFDDAVSGDLRVEKRKRKKRKKRRIMCALSEPRKEKFFVCLFWVFEFIFGFCGVERTQKERMGKKKKKKKKKTVVRKV